MREPWWMRVKQTVCRWFGHKERIDNQGMVYCKRCLLCFRRVEL